MPGERRRQCREERLRDGVPLAPPLVAQLDKMAGELGVKRLSETDDTSILMPAVAKAQRRLEGWPHTRAVAAVLRDAALLQRAPQDEG